MNYPLKESSLMVAHNGARVPFYSPAEVHSAVSGLHDEIMTQIGAMEQEINDEESDYDIEDMQSKIEAYQNVLYFLDTWFPIFKDTPNTSYQKSGGD